MAKKNKCMALLISKCIGILVNLNFAKCATGQILGPTRESKFGVDLYMYLNNCWGCYWKLQSLIFDITIKFPFYKRGSMFNILLQKGFIFNLRIFGEKIDFLNTWYSTLSKYLIFMALLLPVWELAHESLVFRF